MKHRGPPASNLRVAVAVIDGRCRKAGEAPRRSSALFATARPSMKSSTLTGTQSIVVQRVQALPFVQVRAVMLLRAFPRKDGSRRAQKDRMSCSYRNVRPRAANRANTFLHVVVDAFFDVVGIAEHGGRVTSRDRECRM